MNAVFNPIFIVVTISSVKFFYNPSLPFQLRKEGLPFPQQYSDRPPVLDPVCTIFHYPHHSVYALCVAAQPSLK